MLTALLPAFCLAADWVCMGYQGEQTYYVYSEIKTEGKYHMVWIKTTYNTAQERTAQMKSMKLKEDVYEVRRLWAFDKDWTKMALRSSTFHGKDGQTLDTIIAPKEVWNTVAEGSNGDLWRNAAKFILENQ